MELSDFAVGKTESGRKEVLTDIEAEEPDLPYVVGGGLSRPRDLPIREGLLCGKGGNSWA